MGSTRLVEAHDDETAHDIIGKVIEIAAGCVTRFGGRVNRITGDGLMALFGAPNGLAEHALAACSAALDMHAELALARPEVQLRVGVHTGEFLIHPLRAGGMEALDATGGAVHLAARLQQNAAPGETLISGATLTSAGARILAEALPPRDMRGFAEPQDVFRLSGANLGLSRFDEAAQAAQRFIGRNPERSALARLFDQAARGQGQAILVLGEAGIGKTRLAREMAAGAPASMRVLSADALRWRHEAALHPFAQLVSRGSIGAGGNSPALIALGGDEPQDASWIALQPSERREAMIAAATQWLLASAAEGPAAIIFDDLHWADGDTIRAVEMALPGLPGLPLILVLLARPDHSLGARLSALPTLMLAPLSLDEARDLARERGSKPHQLEAIAARSGGNPFFIEQAAALGDELPPHVRSLLVERVDRLPVDASDVLRTIAVIEEPSTPGFLRAVHAPEMDDAGLEAQLDVLDRAGFLQREGLGTGQRISPCHALLQEVVYRGLTRRRRQARHALIVQRIAALPGVSRQMLARHAWLGGLWAEALEHNEAAARLALARYANREVVSHLDRALDALSHLPESPELLQRAVDLRLLLREPLFRLGQSDRLGERLREAEALAERVSGRERVAALRILQAHHAWMTGELAEAERVLGLIEEAGGAAGDEALLLRCRFQRGIIHMSRREHAACAVAMAEVAADGAHPRHAGRYGMDAALCVVALSYQARELADLGDIPAARAAADGCLAAARALGKPFSWIFAVLADGHVMHRGGNAAAAVARMGEALPHCEQAESELMRVVVLMLLGDAELSAGDLEAARAHLEESVRLADGMRFMALQDVRRGLLARACNPDTRR